MFVIAFSPQRETFNAIFLSEKVENSNKLFNTVTNMKINNIV